MSNSKRNAADEFEPLTYWSPSAGNFLTSLVWSLGADLRVHRDAVRVLTVISKSSREEIADIIGEDGNGSYRSMAAKDYADIRSKAIDTLERCIHIAQAQAANEAVREPR